MITPTARAVWLMALGAPLALALNLAAPGLWLAGPAWVLGLLVLLALDWTLAPRGREASFLLNAPEELAAVGDGGEARIQVAFAARRPRALDTALEVDGRLALAPARQPAALDGEGRFTARFHLSPVRRGEARVRRAWARWSGPLGLLDVQTSALLDRVVHVTPNLDAVRREAMRLFSRAPTAGQKVRPEIGDGFEFQALKEFQPGMDIRGIDWKQSARHGLLLAKELRTERNQPIMLALDCGRLMGEPVAGAPKLDRALNAALLIGYVSLAMGDRVGLSAFDSRPRLVGRPVAGPQAFTTLRRLAAGVEYSTEETNFTLGLSSVGSALDRRALLVVFTDFADTTSAQLMLESADRLAHRHLLLFVLFEDEELEAARARPPEAPADVSRAVVADALLRERALVTSRLRRLGAEVLEARADQVGSALIDRYLALKRADRL